ncbi:unnamed protein product [Diamesa serratosioi]
MEVTENIMFKVKLKGTIRQALKKENYIVKRDNFILKTWNCFLTNSSIHCVKYLNAKATNLMEKLIWAIFILLALAATYYTSALLSQRFRRSMTSTVFESTNFPNYEISYPAVSICSNNRLNYNKTHLAVEKFFAGESEESTQTFVDFLYILQNMDFGTFDEFSVLSKRNLTTLDHLNLTEINLFMIHTCAELFISCWWRKSFFNCCDWFTLQKTEYGFCYSFNSFTNEGTKFINRSTHYPWRISGRGQHSALKLIMNSHPLTSVASHNQEAGIIAIINDPWEWPQNSIFVAAGSRKILALKPIVFSTSDDVANLDPDDRQCYYSVRKRLPYMRANCMSECRRVHMLKYCNCSVGFQFPIDDNYPECNVSGILCLTSVNDILNIEKPDTTNTNYESDEGMICDCLPECSRIDYDVESHHINGGPIFNKDYVIVDIHYLKTSMTKFRTDVTFSGMDLMVGFGGIVSLFFGGSILSGAEIFYFLTIGLFWQRRNLKFSRKNVVKSIKARFPFLN